MKQLTRLLVFGGILLILFACQAGCTERDGPAKAQHVRTNVEVWQAVSSTMIDEVTLPGVVEPVRTVTVSGEVAGKIMRILVEEGDEVAQGRKLLVVDKEELALMVEQAQARVTELEALLRQTKSGARPEELAQLRAAVDSARSARDLAAGQAKRRKKLFEDGVVSKEMNDTAQTALIAAEKRLEQASESLKLAQKGAREETVQINEARLGAARTAVQLAKKSLEKTEVYSPMAGLVDKKFVEEGELLVPGKKLFRIVTADRVKVVVWAPERVMTKVRTGDSVRLHFDAVPEPVTAPISRIAFAADEATHTFKTEILLENPVEKTASGSGDRKYRVGYIASVSLRVAEVPEAVKVPIEALILQGARFLVYTVKKGPIQTGAGVTDTAAGFTALANDVELGLKNRNSVQVLSGIKPGDLVIVKGMRFVRDGEAVEVVKTHEGSWPW